MSTLLFFKVTLRNTAPVMGSKTVSLILFSTKGLSPDETVGLSWQNRFSITGLPMDDWSTDVLSLRERLSVNGLPILDSLSVTGTDTGFSSDGSESEVFSSGKTTAVESSSGFSSSSCGLSSSQGCS